MRLLIPQNGRNDWVSGQVCWTGGGGGQGWVPNFLGHAKSAVKKNSLCKKYFHKTTSIHTYIQTYIHTDIHTYIHTDAIVTR